MIGHGRTSKFFEVLAHRCARWAGTSTAFVAASAFTVLWVIAGPLFHFSDTWQLVMNTVSSIATFIMAFLLQRSQNKGTLAMQLKLDEIIATLHGANNNLINIEDLEEQEIGLLYRRYQRLAKKVQNDPNITTESICTKDIGAD